jgi:hypothetical protein
MITLFNNITLTPDVAPIQTDRFVLLGESVNATYQQLLTDPEYNRFDDLISIGTYAGSYSTVADLIKDLPTLVGSDRLEIICSSDLIWQMYTSALKISLPRLDADSLYILLLCQWFQITYIEPNHQFGWVTSVNGQLTASNWINKPTNQDAQALFQNAIPITGITVDPTTLPWEFQLATAYSFPDNSADIQAKMGLVIKGLVYECFARDRAHNMLKNLPDLGKYTGVPYDVDQDLSTYLSQFPILNSIFQLSQRDDFRDFTTVSDADLKSYFSDCTENHIPKHYNVDTGFYYKMSHSNFDSWEELFEPIRTEGLPFFHEASISFNFMGYVNPSILNYLSVNKQNTALISKLAIR